MQFNIRVTFSSCVPVAAGIMPVFMDNHVILIMTLFLAPPPQLRHPPDCDNDVLPATNLVQSQCAPSHSGDWWRKRGARDYEQDYYRAQNNLLNVS